MNDNHWKLTSFVKYAEFTPRIIVLSRRLTNLPLDKPTAEASARDNSHTLNTVFAPQSGDMSGIWTPGHGIYNKPVDALTISGTAATTGPSRRNSQERGEKSSQALGWELYQSEIIEREPAEEEARGEEARNISLHYLRETIYKVDPRYPETFYGFIAQANDTLGFLACLGLRRDILQYWAGMCRQVEYIINQVKTSSLAQTQITLPELWDRVERHTKAVKQAEHELAMSEATLRRQHEDMAKSTAEAEGYTIKMKKLWDEITALQACRGKAEETHGEQARVNAHQQQRHHTQQQSLVAAKTMLNRSTRELEMAQAKHQAIMGWMTQLDGIKDELAQLDRGPMHDA